MNIQRVQTHLFMSSISNIGNYACIVTGILLCYYVLSNKVLDVVRSYLFLIQGRTMIREATTKNGETPFSLPIPGSRVHIVTSKAHFADLNKSHTSQLSLHAAVKQWFSPHLTLGGFQFPDRRDIEGMNLLRGIRSANNRMPHYIPKLFEIVTQEFDEAMSGKSPVNGYVEIPLYSLMRKITLRINTLFIIGEDAANDSEFLETATTYTDRALVTAELCRLVPNWVKGFISYLVQGRQEHRKFVFNEIEKYCEMYIARGEASEDEILSDDRNIPVFEYLTRCYPPEWSTARLVREIATAWMPSIVLASTTATLLLQDIFLRPEHTEALREEILQHYHESKTFDPQKLLFLESYISESTRVHSYESTSGHRVALQDYTFSDGYKVSKGDWVEFNQQAVLNDPKLYPEPDVFDPYRQLRSGRRFKDVSREWPVWGVPKLACPGRVLVDPVLKILVAHVLVNFDCKLSTTKGLHYTWRESKIPNPMVKLLVRSRQG